MKHSLFFFLFFILVNLFYYAPNTIASPIINGIPDQQHMFKFHVSIHNKKSPGNGEYEHVCSGSIISERYILTAAHCFMIVINEEIHEIFYPLGTTKIIAGSNHKNGPGIERDLIRAFIPLEYNADSNIRPGLFVAEGDIAVAELSADLGVHQHPDRLAIIPLEALDPYSNADVNKIASFSGFGHDILQQQNGQLQPANSGDTINKFMNAIILGRNECPMFEKSICVRNIDTTVFRTCCYGDSGSGLVYDYRIVGVLSNGPRNCDTLGPIIFTRLYKYMRFIEEAQNPRGDHSNIMILDTKSKLPFRGRKKTKNPRPHDGSSSSSAGGKKKPPQEKSY